MPEELSVEPGHLDDLATRLQKLADDNSRAESYVKEHIDLSNEQAGLMYGRVAEAIQQVRGVLEGNYRSLGELTSTSANELTASAQMYRTTDTSTATALDRTYPGKNEL